MADTNHNPPLNFDILISGAHWQRDLLAVKRAVLDAEPTEAIRLLDRLIAKFDPDRDRPLTKDDEPLLREWLNCRVAEVDAAGDVWVADPMVGHWLSMDRLCDYADWRALRYVSKLG